MGAALVPDAPEEVPIAVADVKELAPEDVCDGTEAVPVGLVDAVVDTAVPEPLPDGAVMGSVVGDEMGENGGTENGGVLVSWVAVGAEVCEPPRVACLPARFDSRRPQAKITH